ncbi:TPA: hypothetical protein ACIDZ0_006263, partial [Pseudomonas aeruginosa]
LGPFSHKASAKSQSSSIILQIKRPSIWVYRTVIEHTNSANKSIQCFSNTQIPTLTFIHRNRPKGAKFKTNVKTSSPKHPKLSCAHRAFNTRQIKMLKLRQAFEVFKKLGWLVLNHTLLISSDIKDWHVSSDNRANQLLD